MIAVLQEAILPNPLGLDGFEFIEFTAREKGQLEPVFKTLGFTTAPRTCSSGARAGST
jgi:4-hydroxyphenylpyruvate dioxygenase